TGLAGGKQRQLIFGMPFLRNDHFALALHDLPDLWKMVTQITNRSGSHSETSMSHDSPSVNTPILGGHRPPLQLISRRRRHIACSLLAQPESERSSPDETVKDIWTKH